MGSRIGSVAPVATVPIADVVAYLERPFVTIGSLHVSIMLLIEIVVYVVALWITVRVVNVRLDQFLRDRWKADPSTAYAITRLTGYAIWAVGTFIGLPMMGIDLSHVALAVGALGVGIGLGLQNLTENLVGGLILLVARPIKVGDRIQLEGAEGMVIDIGPRVTQIRTNDNICLLVPNAEFISKRVVNLTFEDRLVRFRFPVGVSYGADPKRVREALLAVARAHPDLVDDPPPRVLFMGFGDSALEFALWAGTRTRVHDPDVLRSEVNFRIFEALAQAGISIPFPQRDLHVRSVAPDVVRALSGQDPG